MNKPTALAVAMTVLLGAANVAAESDNKVSVHGSVQADILFPEEDFDIGTERYDSKILGNGYANAALFSKYVDAGLRVEYMQYPLPGFEPDFKGWGIPNFFAKGKYKGLELTPATSTNSSDQDSYSAPTKSAPSASTTPCVADALKSNACPACTSPPSAASSAGSGSGAPKARSTEPISSLNCSNTSKNSTRKA